MKRKIMSTVLAALVIVSSAPISSLPVFATNKDSNVNVSKTKSSDDIEVKDSNDGIAITDNTSKDDSDIKIDSSETSSSDGITVTESETNAADTADIQIEDVLTASATYQSDKKELNTGDVAKVHVKAENKSEQAATLKLYFCNTDEKLSDDKISWSSYLKNPALEMSIKDLKKDCTLEVPVVDKDKNETKSSLKFLKEVKDDKVLSRYAVMTLSPGTSTEFDVSVTDDAAGTVSVIPVMEQTATEFGDAATLTWEENITFVDKVVNFFTKEDKSADIQISDVQGVEKGLDDVDDADFASSRLVVMTDKDSVFTDKDTVIGHYGNIYLVQYDSVAKTKEAYARLKDKVKAVEPDKDVTAATNEVTATLLAEETTKSEDTAVEDATEEITETVNADNAIAGLNDMKTSKEVQKTKGVIALIDTGVSESDNVIARVSMIDDVLEGNGHGDKMLADIVSQDAEAKVLSIRAMNDNGFGTVSSLVAAMEYAIDQKVDYINLSLYARTTLSTSVLEEEIVKATKAGITVVGAAGNDGADVKDYVPGSVEEAYIIGAAKDTGARQELSNFGSTVDYNVVAESTSDATALFTGYISANGLKSVKDVLNKGLIYATDYVKPEAPDVVVDDLNKLDVVKDKVAVVKYLYVYADKIKEDTTIDNVFDAIYDNTSKVEDVEFGNYVAGNSMESQVTIYDAKDGTYKFKAQAPLLNGYMSTSTYQDAVFAHANNNAEVLSKGVKFDKSTGIATVDSKLVKKQDGDFADIQLQVLVPVKGSAEEQIKQSIEIVNADGSTYQKSYMVSPGMKESVPLAIEGTETTLSADDFKVYVNDNKTPVSVTWDDEEKMLYVPYTTSDVYRVRVELVKNVDSVFQVANLGPGTTPYFYLPEGTDVNVLKAKRGVDVVADTAFGYGVVGGEGYPGYSSSPNTVITNRVLGNPDEYDGADSSMGWFGIPKNLFGVNFDCQNASGQSYGYWTATKGYPSTHNTQTGMNAGLSGSCVHVSNIAAFPRAVTTHKNFTYRITDYWESGGYTYFRMLVYGNSGTNNWYSGGYRQTTGGDLVFAVKSEVKKYTWLSITKTWADQNNKFATRPQSVTVELIKDGKATGQTKTLNAGNSWSAKWTDLLYESNAGKHSYDIQEHPIAGYTNGDIDWKGSYEKGWTGTVTNTVNLGYLKLHKSSSLPDIADKNPCYNLSGAVYTVYTDEACTTEAVHNGDLITDENGNTGTVELKPGNYWVKETKTTDDGHYEIDKKPHKVTVAADDTKDEPALLNVEDVPGNDPAGISVTKIWKGEKTETVPPLTGTQFTICYYAGEYDKSTLPSTPTRKWVIEVQYNKNTDKYFAGLTDTYLVKSESDELYKSAKGNTVLPYGTYTVQETKAAAGYTLEGAFVDKHGNTISPKDIYLTKVLKKGDAIALQGGNEYASEDSPKPSKITLKKFDTDGKTPLAGAKFELKNAKGEVVATKTAGDDGVIEFADLYPDVYTITELETKDRHTLLKEPITVKCPMTVTEDDIKKYNIDKSQCVYDDKQDVYYIFNQTYNVTNDASFDVPMTGGVFTPKMLIPLAAGLVIMTGALFISLRKKRSI